MKHEQLPTHVAIIMDGNGRWAVRRGLRRMFGHRAGAEAVRRTVEAACELGIRVLTLYAFSWENWDRPQHEIRGLMGLLEEFLRRELPTLRKQRIRLRAIGRLHLLPPKTLAYLEEVMRDTASHERMTLVLALSYGGRQEIVDAAKRLAWLVKEGHIQPDQIDDALLARHLTTADLPDPDLIIRTSGEQRLSNFLLWQSSYAELYVTPRLWPDFGRTALLEALRAYAKRERRFGRTETRQASPSRAA